MPAQAPSLASSRATWQTGHERAWPADTSANA